MIKIDKFEETTDVVVLHPVDGTELVHEDGRKVSITVYGTHSAHFQSLTNQQLNKRLKNPNRKLTAEQSKERQIQLLVDSTVSLNNFDGVDLGNGEVDVEDVYNVYCDYPWLMEQVDSAMVELGNFTSKPTKKRKTS